MGDCSRVDSHRDSSNCVHVAGNQSGPHAAGDSPQPVTLCLPERYSFFRIVGQEFLDRLTDHISNTRTQSCNIIFGHALGFDGVVKMDGDGGGPEYSLSGAVMLERTDDTDRHDGHFKLLGNAEYAVLEFVHAAIASALPFRKDYQASAAVDGIPRQTPHSFQVCGTADIGHRNIPEALHQPAVNGNFKMRFQLPSADELRDCAVKRKGIEKIDVIGNKKTGFRRIRTGRAHDTNFCARKKNNPAAKGALQPIVLLGIENNRQSDQDGHGYGEMKQANEPEQCAAETVPCAPHM